MNTQIIISIDAMGGDFAPEAIISALDFEFAENVKFMVFGDSKIIEPLLNKQKKPCVEVIHTDDNVTSEDRPSFVIRSKRKSSMALAITSVKENNSHAVVSAGNTGAYMALSKLILGTMPGIERPAIATLLPTIKGKSVVLDLGANVECLSRNLIEFALMGEALAEIELHTPSPSVSLLNVGTEDMKGNKIVQEASTIIKQESLLKNYIGFVEGDGITKGSSDVIVTDGFTGNIALKAIEGTAHFIASSFKKAFKDNALAQLGAFLAQNSLRKTASSLDPRVYNGAIFLGLNGVAVKSHGSTDELGFYHAIQFAIRIVKDNLLNKVQSKFSKLDCNEIKRA